MVKVNVLTEMACQYTCSVQNFASMVGFLMESDIVCTLKEEIGTTEAGDQT